MDRHTGVAIAGQCVVCDMSSCMPKRKGEKEKKKTCIYASSCVLIWPTV
jgi:hypothetical protein